MPPFVVGPIHRVIGVQRSLIIALVPATATPAEVRPVTAPPPPMPSPMPSPSVVIIIVVVTTIIITIIIVTNATATTVATIANHGQSSAARTGHKIERAAHRQRNSTNEPCTGPHQGTTRAAAATTFIRSRHPGSTAIHVIAPTDVTVTAPALAAAAAPTTDGRSNQTGNTIPQPSTHTHQG